MHACKKSIIADVLFNIKNKVEDACGDAEAEEMEELVVQRQPMGEVCESKEC